MRTLTLFSIILLFPLLSSAQSVDINYVGDSSGTGGCDTVDQSIYHYVNGSSTGLSSGDTIDVHVDHDDGNGLQYTGWDTVGSNGYFWFEWYNSWNSSGSKSMTVVTVGPNGNSDTAYHTAFISDSCATIQGKVYLDSSGNCMYDNGEPLMTSRSVKVEHSNQLVGYGYTDQSGVYQVDVPANLSPYEVTLLDSGNYTKSCPSSGVITVNNPPSYGVNFGLNCSQNPDFGVSHGHAWNFRVGWDRNLYFGAFGPSHCQDSLDCIKMVLNSHLTPLPTDSGMPDYDAVNGDTVVWNMDTNDLSDFHYGRLPVDVDPNAPVGDTICAELILCSSNDADPSNNTMEICGEVVNSCDPNNKEVMPHGEGPENHIAKNQRMRYTINFKNTGNAPAIDVRIEDTVDTDVLDLNSFRVVSSSHEIDKVEILEDSILKFHHNDIMLPDSGTSQAESEGYVRIEMDQQPNLADGTVIENNAAIFFDQNAPIITNEAMNTIGEASSLRDPKAEDGLSVFPNPAKERVHVRSADEMQGQLILRDMVGKQVLQESVNGSHKTVDLDGLPSGIYMLSLDLEEEKGAVRRKLIVE